MVGLILGTCTFIGALYMAACAQRMLTEARIIRDETREFRGQLIRLVQDNIRNL